MSCVRCQDLLVERRPDFSPDTFIWRCIHCASIADPGADEPLAGTHLYAHPENRSTTWQ